MEPDLLGLYERASEWTATKVPGAATKLDAATPCDELDVRTLMNHMLDTQLYFVGVARGEDVSPPSPIPPELLSDSPIADFDRARAETQSTFADPGVIEKTGPSLGIAFSDQLLHGWDLAMATAARARLFPNPHPNRPPRSSSGSIGSSVHYARPRDAALSTQCVNVWV